MVVRETYQPAMIQALKLVCELRRIVAQNAGGEGNLLRNPCQNEWERVPAEQADGTRAEIRVGT